MTAARTARLILTAVALLASLAIVVPSTTETVATILAAATFAAVPLSLLTAVLWFRRRTMTRRAEVRSAAARAAGRAHRRQATASREARGVPHVIDGELAGPVRVRSTRSAR